MSLLTSSLISSLSFGKVGMKFGGGFGDGRLEDQGSQSASIFCSSSLSLSNFRRHYGREKQQRSVFTVALDAPVVAVRYQYFALVWPYQSVSHCLNECDHMFDVPNVTLKSLRLSWVDRIGSSFVTSPNELDN